jgi:cytochrome o ubiquinol oxidase subunit 2
MPGMVSQLNLQADRPATLFGQSSHFSGDGFSDMQFQVKSLPADQFASWVRDVRSTGAALDRPAYADLARQSQRVPPLAFGRVDPQLFHAIASQQIAPAPGPEAPSPEHAGREISTVGGR